MRDAAAALWMACMCCLMYRKRQVHRGPPVEVSHQGADISGRVLFRVLPFALPDVIYVLPQTLRPCTRAGG